MPRRKGVTLIEVLAAIFIAGVGLLALMTLFPLGAISMGQAIKDDRCGHIRESAAAIANIVWESGGNRFTLRTDDPYDLANNPQPYNLTAAMSDPAGGGTTFPYTPRGSETSYPVFVDPIGWNAYSINANYANTYQKWLCGLPGNNAGSMRRASFRLLEDPAFDTNTPPPGPARVIYQRQQRLRWMTFLDDIHFPRDVQALGLPGNPVERAPRYSWAYICRRPTVSEPIVELTVVVFSGRSLELTGGQPEGETQYDAAFDTADNTVTLSWTTQPPPELREGRWILDPNSNVVNNPPNPPRLITRGYFYRVVSVEASGPNSMTVQVQPTLRNHVGNIPPIPFPKVIVMDNVVEVFERSTN